MIQSTNLVTIAIPVYERYDYIEEAIISCINQSIKCPILIVDNGSSHNRFYELCQRFSEYGVRYHKNAKNIGMFGNWNKCVSLCETEYVMILGDDDLLNQDYIKEFVLSKQHYPSIDCYYTNINVFPVKYSNSYIFNIPYGFNKGDVILEYAAKYGLGFPTVSMILRKSLFKENYYLENFHASNDWLWLYSNIDKLNIYGNEKRLLSYRKHHGSDSLKSICINNISWIHIYWDIYLRLSGINSKYSKQALKKAKNSLIKCIIMYSDQLFEFINNYHESDNIYYKSIKNKVIPRSIMAQVLIRSKVIRLVMKKLLLAR